MASRMLPVRSDQDAETGRIAENALLNRVYHEVQEIPSANFQAGEAPATVTGGISVPKIIFERLA